MCMPVHFVICLLNEYFDWLIGWLVGWYCTQTVQTCSSIWLCALLWQQSAVHNVSTADSASPPTSVFVFLERTVPLVKNVRIRVDFTGKTMGTYRKNARLCLPQAPPPFWPQLLCTVYGVLLSHFSVLGFINCTCFFLRLPRWQSELERPYMFIMFCLCRFLVWHPRLLFSRTTERRPLKSMPVTGGLVVDRTRKISPSDISPNPSLNFTAGGGQKVQNLVAIFTSFLKSVSLLHSLIFDALDANAAQFSLCLFIKNIWKKI